MKVKMVRISKYNILIRDENGKYFVKHRNDRTGSVQICDVKETSEKGRYQYCPDERGAIYINQPDLLFEQEFGTGA